ncbi:MAG: TIGR02757 family protein [Marinifilaceae bacterium]
MNDKELKEFLDEKYLKYNNTNFVETDPIQIPREFTKKENIEISAFLAATIAWGQRKTIINNAYKLVNWMDNDPLDFLMNAKDKDYLPFKDFKHRTFNGNDCIFFLKSLANIYKKHGGLEEIFSYGDTLHDGLINARKIFFSIEHPETSGRQFSNIEKKSAAKRLNMYLRWMVRKDEKGVDFGIWDKISPSQLYLPLDVHTASVGRKLELLTRKQNDWKAVEEITGRLRKFDVEDPVKYDFALFGLGAFEKL